MPPDLSMEIIQQRLDPVFQLSREIGHALGTPLAVVMGNISRLKNRGLLDDDMNLALEDMLLMTTKCVELQRSLSSISRSTPFQKAPFDLFPRLQFILENIFSGSSKSVVLENQSELKKTQFQVHVTSFEELLRLIIQNAFDFTYSTGKLRIRYSRDVKNGLDQLHFIDDGSGIDSQTLQRVFDPFFSTKSMPNNHGLSLTQAVVILISHGGRIDVWQRNPGVEFVVSIPG